MWLAATSLRSLAGWLRGLPALRTVAGAAIMKVPVHPSVRLNFIQTKLKCLLSVTGMGATNIWPAEPECSCWPAGLVGLVRDAALLCA